MTDIPETVLADLYADLNAAKLRHLLIQRDRQANISRKFWVRAAKAALAGDMRELRNRVDMAEAWPMKIELSSQANPTTRRAAQ